MMLRPLWTWQRWMAAATPKVHSDRFAERLRAIDDEQPGQRRIEPPGEEIVEQGLDDDMCSPSPPRPRPGHACRRCHRRRSPPSNRTWSPTCRPSIWMTEQVELREIRGEPGLHLLAPTAPQSAGKRHRDFEVPSPRAFARSPSGRRTARWYLRVDTFRHHQVERPLEQQVAGRVAILPALQ